MKSEFEVVKKILEKYANDTTKLISILQDVQKEFRYLPENVLIFIATSLAIPPSKVYGVATFFSHFALTPRGKNIIKICDGTACHVKKSENIINTLRERFKIQQGKITSDDGFVSLEIVSCLGACGLAPVIVVNDEVYGEMTVEKLNKIIDELK
jgi:NADH-quinone oxidoreductase subunit E